MLGIAGVAQPIAARQEPPAAPMSYPAKHLLGNNEWCRGVELRDGQGDSCNNLPPSVPEDFFPWIFQENESFATRTSSFCYQ